MIELDWTEGDPVNKPIRSIERLPGPRRTRLIAVAFCDRVARSSPMTRAGAGSRSPRRADKQARRTDMAKVHAVAERAYDKTCIDSTALENPPGAAQLALRAVKWTLHPTHPYYACVVSYDASEAVGDAANEGIPEPRPPEPGAVAAENTAQLRILRDVLGRPDGLPPADVGRWLGWNGGLVPKLARGVYED